MENQIVVLTGANGQKLIGVCVEADKNGIPLTINVWGVKYQKVGKLYIRKD